MAGSFRFSCHQLLSFRATSSLLPPAVSRHSPLHGFDAPFSYREPAAALSKCHESVPGADLRTCSVFKVHFPWWRHVLLSFLNIILQWAVVPSSWKSSTRLLLASISLLLCVQGVRAPDLRPHRTPYFRTIGGMPRRFFGGAPPS